MITLGIDLASKPKNTAACSVDWSEAPASIQLRRDLSDKDLLDVFVHADKVGVDIPFGWPESFVETVHAHHEFRPWKCLDMPKLRLRATDRHVADRKIKNPLSVSTEKIGVPALRMAALLARLAEQGQRVDRSGSGKFVEVYPALALKVWGFRHERYKGKKYWENRIGLVDAIHRSVVGLLDVSACVEELRNNDHALDSLVAALVARAHALQACEPIPSRQIEAARREGWIAIPAKSLSESLRK